VDFIEDFDVMVVKSLENIEDRSNAIQQSLERIERLLTAVVNHTSGTATEVSDLSSESVKQLKKIARNTHLGRTGHILDTDSTV
jgi:hypothetical protein